MNITMNNCTVSIYEAEDKVEKAKSELLNRLYYAREKDTMGGRDGWLELLDMYFMYRYEDMVEKIKSFTGKGQATRNACLRCLKTIIEEG